MDCKHVDRHAFQFFDNEMDEEQLNRFQAHVESCGACRQKVAVTRQFLLIIRRRCVRCEAPVGLRRRIMISLQQYRGPRHDA